MAPHLDAVSEAQCRAALEFALRLLEEDELAHLSNGTPEEIAYGRWLTLKPAGRAEVMRRVLDRLPLLVERALGERLSQDFHAYGQFVGVRALGALIGRSDNKVFDGMEPRSLLLPVLMQAYLSTNGGEPRLAAFSWYDGYRFGGGDARKAYGAHRLNSSKTASHLSGIAGLAGDALLPLTCLPDVVGLSDAPDYPKHDPTRFELARDMLSVLGATSPPSTPEHHLELHLGLISAARAILRRAARHGSRVCRRYEVRATDLLERGFPSYLCMGAIGVGVGGPPVPRPARWCMPGSDMGLMTAVRRHRLQPLMLLFDGLEIHQSEHFRDIIFRHDGVTLTGAQFAHRLTSPKRFTYIPGLEELTPAAAAELVARRDMRELGLSVDPGKETWLVQPEGLILADGRGRSAQVSYVMCSRGPLSTGYIVPGHLHDADERARVLARCMLHVGNTRDPRRSRCIDRVFDEHKLHKPTTWMYSTAAYIRVVNLMVNLGVVSASRTWQVKRPAA